MGRKNNKKKKNKNKQLSPGEFTGELEITRSGMGYVIVENLHRDILIKPADINTAFHGDIVKVAVRQQSRHGRMEGVVKEIKERKQQEYIGHLEMNHEFAFFVPDSNRPMPDFFIPKENLNGAVDNSRVLVKFVRWDKKDKKPVGKVEQVITAENEGDLAMKEILLENGFPLIFSEEVIEETLRLPDTISEEDMKGRKDCRDILTFTIDPEDAKDFDDALSIRKLNNGFYEIGVHIADVSHFVQPGSELDKEAYEKATSVYLPDRVLPMLPEKISNELCSLRPNENKLTFSAIFQMNEKADIKHYWVGRTVIHSDHRFNYDEVQEVIEKNDGLYKHEILLMNKMAQKMRKQRFEKGAINFSSQEVRFKLDETGKPIGIVLKESKEAHQLIEEFMLLANRTVATYLNKFKVNKKQVPFPYRVHDTPDEEKLAPFVEFAKKYGHKFDVSNPQQIAFSFNKMLTEVQGKPEQHVLEQLGIRTMAKALYTTENTGHYGLGFENYCHFTSPIRRYPDVLVHRVLQECIDGKPLIDKKMEQKCKHCSERERAAMESERAANKYKQVEFMKDKLGEEFDGVVSGVASFGFWVETIEHKCEGLASINSLLDFDDFRLIESEYCLAGRRSGRKFQMGDKVRIKIISANLSRRQLDYEWVVTQQKTEEEKKEKPQSNTPKQKHKKKKK